MNNGIKILEDDSIFINSISVVGGVANNEYIKRNLENNFNSKKIRIFYPIKEMMSDNAAMIAWACIKNYKKNKHNLFFKPQSRMRINEISQNKHRNIK